jgi:hypothetical protein
MRPCFTRRGVKYDRGELFGTDEGIEGLAAYEAMLGGRRP